MNLTTSGGNQTRPGFEKTGVIILLVRSRKEAPLSFSTILSISMLLIVLGVVVNGAICFVMLRGKRYKRNTSNFFILHLSIMELVSRLLIFPIVVYSLVTTSVTENVQCKFLTFVSTTLASATFISLAAIAFDRYQNILHPMQALKSKKKPVHLFFLVWLYANIASLFSVVSVKSISVNEISEGMDCESCTDIKICDIPQTAMGQIATTLYFSFTFLVPLILIFVLYTKIAIFLHQRSNNGMMHKVAARSKSKAIRMLVLAVIGYVLSLGPAALFAMLRSYGNLNNTSFNHMFAVSWMVQIVTLTSSLANPIIYAYFNGDFRKELVRPFCKKKTRAPVLSLSLQTRAGSSLHAQNQ